MNDFAPTLLSGKRFAVLGLGRNGAIAATRLAAMGAYVLAWDDNEAGRATLTQNNPHGVDISPITDLEGFSALVMSPGIPHVLPKAHPIADLARLSGVPILSDAELLYRLVRLSGSHARFASVTGTNGKSTTTVLLEHILKQAGIMCVAGGNLGPSALSLPLLPDDGVYVIEMSSYMLERLDQFHANAACLLNLTPDHLDRHGDMAGYAKAKSHVFDNQGPGDLAVLGVGDVWCDEIRHSLISRGMKVQTVSGHADDADYSVDNGLLLHAGTRLADLSLAKSLPGDHNAENAAAATAMAMFLGVKAETIQNALTTFSGLPHRQKLIATKSDVDFVDDSKATNADAASRALGCYDRLIWIAGGVSKEGGIDTLSPFFNRIAKAYLIGRDAAEFSKTLVKHNVAHEIVETLENAVPASFETAQAIGVKTVLLSPACASFDQFKSFEHRGQKFQELVERLSADEFASSSSQGQ